MALFVPSTVASQTLALPRESRSPLRGPSPDPGLYPVPRPSLTEGRRDDKRREGGKERRGSPVGHVSRDGGRKSIVKCNGRGTPESIVYHTFCSSTLLWRWLNISMRQCQEHRGKETSQPCSGSHIPYYFGLVVPPSSTVNPHFRLSLPVCGGGWGGVTSVTSVPLPD